MSDNQNEAQGAALASFAVSINTLRLLSDKGIITQDEASKLISRILLTLEQSGLVEESASHSARQLLQGFAAEFGVDLKPQN